MAAMTDLCDDDLWDAVLEGTVCIDLAPSSASDDAATDATDDNLDAAVDLDAYEMLL